MKSLGWMGATLGGAITGGIGWWLTSSFGVYTAFIVSTITTGFGMYYGRKWVLQMVGM